MKYVATFVSHYSAQLTNKKLVDAKIKSNLAPTPRSVSSSCGTCVIYNSDDPHIDLMDSDYEAIYLLNEKTDKFTLVVENH